MRKQRGWFQGSGWSSHTRAFAPGLNPCKIDYTSIALGTYKKEDSVLKRPVPALAIVAFVVCAALFNDVSRGQESQKINVGLQLYSLRAQFPKDVPGTMAWIQKVGITDVEAASFYNLSAQQFKEELDKHGLHASGAHFQWDQFDKDIDGCIRDAKTLGCEFITMPWIPHNGEFTLKDAQKAIAKFNEWGAKCREAGLRFTYHPHGYEFRPTSNGTLFDLMVKETKPEDVNYEIDIFWAYDGGADPVKLMEKYPTRFVQMHLKDMDKSVKVPKYEGHENVDSDVALGTGQIPIKAIVEEGIKIGIKHYYIEDESSHSEQQIPVSIQYIRSIGH